MKSAAFDYVAPRTIAEAVDAVRATAGARVLAGGQSLLPALYRRDAEPALLVDLRRIDGLDRIELSGDAVTVGARVTQLQAERHAELRAGCPLLSATLPHVGYPQTRSRGTIVGSLVHADPLAELPAVFLALDGTLIVSGRQGQRAIAARDLYLGPFRTSLAPDEIAVAAVFPRFRPGAGAACVEIALRGNTSTSGCVVAAACDADGAIAWARVALFGVGGTQVRARATERAVEGVAHVDQATVARTLERDLDRPDMAAPGEHRRDVAGVLTRRALERAMHAARGATE